MYDRTLCTSSRNGTCGCRRDSGGPLALNGQLIGVKSWAEQCAKGTPEGFLCLRIVFKKYLVLSRCDKDYRCPRSIIS